MKEQKKCEACAKRTSLIGLAAGIFLVTFKLFVGFLGRSRALIASGMCNLSDVTSALVVLTGVKYSRNLPNRRYPYGYGKLEFIAQVAISLFMILGNVVLLMSSFLVIARRLIIIPHVVVFFTAVISAVINGMIYKFAHCGANELNSPALRSHAEHNKIDVASSLLVAIGVLAARAGLHMVDPLIAIFECAHVIYGSWRIFWDGFKGIMDTSLPEEHIKQIKYSLAQLSDIKKITKIKARQAGQKILLDLVVQLEPGLSVLEAKRIVQNLKSHLRLQDRYIGNIFVQVVPADEIVL